MAKQIKTVTKTNDLANVRCIRNVPGNDFIALHRTLRIYLSASNAKLVKVRGQWFQLKGQYGRNGYSALDWNKPYKWPTRARRNDMQKKMANAKLKKEALTEAKKVLSKKHLKALGLIS